MTAQDQTGNYECPDCGEQLDTMASAVGHRCGQDVPCPSCAGDGFVDAQEYHCDWVNYPKQIMVCPKCKGRG